MRATLTSKGQITLPVELRRRWELKAGDQLDFAIDDGRVLLRKHIRRSIFEALKELPPLSLGRPLTQEDIDRAVDEGMEEQERRVRREDRVVLADQCVYASRSNRRDSGAGGGPGGGKCAGSRRLFHQSDRAR